MSGRTGNNGDGGNNTHKDKRRFTRRLLLAMADVQSQYTTKYRPSQTTSTKCQYQAAPSKPK